MFARSQGHEGVRATFWRQDLLQAQSPGINIVGDVGVLGRPWRRLHDCLNSSSKKRHREKNGVELPEHLMVQVEFSHRKLLVLRCLFLLPYS